MSDATIGPVDRQVAEAHLRSIDPILAGIIDRTGPFDPDPRAEPDVFHALTRAIVYQQLSGKAAATIHRRLFDALGGDTALSPASILATPDEQLRGAGLSANKMRALRGLAEATQNGHVPKDSELAHYTDDELITAFSTLRGIGRWTVEMLLIFHLERPDVLPVDDLGIRKGFARTYGWQTLPKPKQLASYCESWRPYRSVASWYMWRATELT
ncbi:DNA-3-methyladenine glycosylase family protein [Salinisphaera orenii]|uniref:DNA-3-methyladenine glycosylase family protein n=1 Tax=Salinisphaera orenii TaxID=856731 RepID=UPI000DBE332F